MTDRGGRNRIQSISIGASIIALVVAVLASNTAEAGLSGDLAIDLTLGTAYKVRAGGSGGRISRGSTTYECGPNSGVSFENNCPNDQTYTPSSHTGGYQAWGVGVSRIDSTRIEEECSLDLGFGWLNGEIAFYLFEDCNIVEVAIPDETWGLAMVRLKWGTGRVGSANNIGTHPTSVTAFHPNLADDCEPSNAVFVAECDIQDNTSYVDGAGYEAEIHIDDPGCNFLFGGTRDGDYGDFLSGCFVFHPYPQVSNFPANYQDITTFDEPEILNIGFGTEDAASLVPGFTYTLKQFFKSKYTGTMLFKDASHRGQITRELPLNPVCLANGSVPEWCRFAIDTAEVGGSDTFQTITVPGGGGGGPPSP